MNDSLFAAFPHTPSEHFKLYFYAAVLRVISQVMLRYSEGEQPPDESAFTAHPFLANYLSELADFGLEGVSLLQAQRDWQSALQAWEQAAPSPLPITVLSHVAGLDYTTLTLLMAIGLLEEDARFGPLYASAQGIPGQHRPTLALLSAWWGDEEGSGQVRRMVQRLQELGLLEVINPDAPRLEWAFQPCSLAWDALQGELSSTPAAWCQYIAPESLLTQEDVLLPAGLQRAVVALPALFDSGEVQTVVVRGAQGDGRRTLLGALARQMNRGLMVITGMHARVPEDGAASRWLLIGPLAVLFQALPVVVFDLAPGESAELPGLAGGVPLAVIMGRSGGLTGSYKISKQLGTEILLIILLATQSKLMLTLNSQSVSTAMNKF